MSDSDELVNQQGATSIYIDIEFNGNGDLVISGQDIGQAPMAVFGDSDYEYWLTVPAYEKDNLLIALIEQHYAGDVLVVSKLRKLMDSKKIANDFYSY